MSIILKESEIWLNDTIDKKSKIKRIEKYPILEEAYLLGFKLQSLVI